MKELMTEWRSYLNEISGTTGVLNYAYITIETSKIFERHGFSLALANSLTKNIVNGLKNAVSDAIKNGVGIENSANIVSNLGDGLNGLFQLCTKFGIDPGGYFSQFLGYTAEGTLAAGAMTFLSLVLLSKGIGDWLSDTGKEFQKSGGPLAIKELHELEKRIETEGFDAVKRSEANTSTKQGDISVLFTKAVKFYPNAVKMFPKVFNLMDKGWQKSFL